MIKHLIKSKNIDEYGKINEIVFIENYFILLTDYFNNDKYCNIIKTNFSDYRNTFNLLEKIDINPINFLQKINDSTLFINTFKDFTGEYFRLKGLKIVFPIEVFKKINTNTIKDDNFKPIFYWIRNQKYIAVYRKIKLKKTEQNWFRNDISFEICILNSENVKTKEIPLVYYKEQNIFKRIFNKKNLIVYLNEYKFCDKYFAFVNNENLFVLNFETSKIIKYELKNKYYVIQEINDENEIVLTLNKNLIILKINQNEIIQFFDIDLKSKIKTAKCLNTKLIVIFSKMVKIYDLINFRKIKEYGLPKNYMPKIITTIENEFVIIYNIYNKKLIKYEQKISFFET